MAILYTCIAINFKYCAILYCIVHYTRVSAYMHTYMVQFSFLERRQFETISLALTHPYKDGCGWWAPLELLRRYVFLIAVIFNPGYLV